MQRRTYSRNSRSANAIIEMAIAFPVLIYLGMGLAEFGQFFYVKTAFEAAARDAARFSISPTAVQGTPATTATTALALANITFSSSWMTIVNDNTGATITDVSTVPAGTAMTFTIKQTYSLLPVYRPLFQMTGKGIGAGKIVMGECTAVRE